ncbi:MAG: SPOR domain-containing protein, partial [Candidatus Marinimicrobia bacterium]|nr:SPOR domain-containing protein [Candidatus Neomarinimicrobiota bacterium]
EDSTVDTINEISQDDVIQTDETIQADETEKISNEQEDDVWEDVPSIPQNEKKHSIPSQKYTIQFSSSHNKEFSEIAVTDLRKLGYDAYIKKSYLPNDSRPWYRVRVGNYSYSEAKSVLRSLERRTNQKGIWIDKK